MKTVEFLKASATAHPSQPMIPFHGFVDGSDQVLPVDTLFCTLAGLTTHVSIELLETRNLAEVLLNNKPMNQAEIARVRRFICTVTEHFGLPSGFRLHSVSNFPRGCGLGSSAAAFAAVAGALGKIAGVEDVRQIAAIARRGSISAANSVVGGISVLFAGASRLWANRVLDPGDFPFEVYCIPISEVRAHSMHEQARQSPFYSAALEQSRTATSRTIECIRARSYADLANLVERQMFTNIAMLSTGSVGEPMWRPVTLQLYLRLRELRLREGTCAFMAMSSGPSAYCYVLSKESNRILNLIDEGGFTSIRARPGPGYTITDEHLF